MRHTEFRKLTLACYAAEESMRSKLLYVQDTTKHNRTGIDTYG